MKNLYLTGCLLLCCIAHSQTGATSKNGMADNKYVGMIAQQPEASQIIYTTDERLLKNKSQTPKPSGSAQIVATPESAKKKSGPILPAVPINTK